MASVEEAQIASGLITVGNSRPARHSGEQPIRTLNAKGSDFKNDVNINWKPVKML